MLRFHGSLLPATLLSLLLAACGGGGSPDSSDGDFSEALDPTTQPVTVTTTLDESRAVSARIGPSGGVLAATGADGSLFYLTIPPDVLIEEIDFEMIPLISMEGLPLSEGLVAGVQLRPEGLPFYGDVTLTIMAVEAIPVEQQLPIGSSGENGALYIPLIDTDPYLMTLHLLHFSSAGYATGLTSELEPVRQRLGGDIEERLVSLASLKIAERRQIGETCGDGYLDQVYAVYWEQVVQPRMAAAGESCAAARLAINTLTNYTRQHDLMSLSGCVDPLPEDRTVMTDMMPAMARVCLQEEYELCRDDHVVDRMLPSIRTLDRQANLMGGVDGWDQVMVEAEDLAVKCLRFELEFQSSAEFVADNVEVVSEVEANVIVQYEAGSQLSPRGSATLVNSAFEITPTNGCTATGVTGDGTFAVLSLSFDSRAEYFRAIGLDLGGEEGIVDVRLRYDPGQTTESVTNVVCPGNVNPPYLPGGGYWSTYFLATHLDEAGRAASTPDFGIPGGSGGFLDIGWEVHEGDELLAELEWAKPSVGVSPKKGRSRSTTGRSKRRWLAYLATLRSTASIRGATSSSTRADSDGQTERARDGHRGAKGRFLEVDSAGEVARRATSRSCAPIRSPTPSVTRARRPAPSRIGRPQSSRASRAI